MLDSKLIDFIGGARKTLQGNRVIKSSLPCTYDEMERISEWLMSPECHFSKMEAVMLDALFALAWTCMLRIEEALSIEIADVQLNQAVIVNGVTYEHHLLIVSNRKNDKGTNARLINISYH